MKRAILGLSVALAACTPPRIVAPLRYDAAPLAAKDEPFRASRPPPSREAPLPSFKTEEATLANGVRVVVVPRAGRDRVAARMAFACDVTELDDKGAARIALVAPVLLRSEEAERTAWASCSQLGCEVGSDGTKDELAAVLDRVAHAVVSPAPSGPAAERRLRAERSVRAARSLGSGSASWRNADAALFAGTAYAPTREVTPAVTVNELEHVRDAVLTPSRATLVVTGDVSLDVVRAAAAERFAAWQARPGAVAVATTRVALLPLPAGRRVVTVQRQGLSQIHGSLFARGPRPGDPDSAAFRLICSVLGGGPSSTAFEHVREDLGAAYSLGAELRGNRDVTVLALGGSFDPGKAITGLTALVDAARALRDTDVAPDRLERARAMLIGQWRAQTATSVALAGSVTWLALTGEPLDPDAAIARLRAVTAADVRRVAQRWLAEDQLRVVLVGDLRFVQNDLPALRLGPAVVRDALARDQ